MADSEARHGSSLTARCALGARHGLMTAAAAWTSYASSASIGLHEGYWAAISSIVVMQTQWADTESSARDRFLGSAIGGLIAWGCALCWNQHVGVYALAVAFSVFVCWAVGLNNAGRLAGVTVSVIVLIPQHESIWKIALSRFLEVSWGIAVTVAITALAVRVSRIRNTPRRHIP